MERMKSHVSSVITSMKTRSIPVSHLVKKLKESHIEIDDQRRQQRLIKMPTRAICATDVPAKTMA